jgi:hypothetical protein
VKSSEQIEAELLALGWTIESGPARTSAGWKATMARGSSMTWLAGETKLSLLGYMLCHAQTAAGMKP